MIISSDTPADQIQEYETLCPNDYTPLAERLVDFTEEGPEVLFVCPICEYQTVLAFDAPVEID